MIDEEVEFYAQKAHEYLKKEPSWTGHFVNTGEYEAISENAKERRRAIARFTILMRRIGPDNK